MLLRALSESKVTVTKQIERWALELEGLGFKAHDGLPSVSIAIANAETLRAACPVDRAVVSRGRTRRPTVVEPLEEAGEDVLTVDRFPASQGTCL